MTFVEWSLYNNPVSAWLVALGIVIVTWVALRLIRGVAERQLVRISGRTATDLDDALVAALRRTRGWFLVIVSVWAGSVSLVIPDDLRDVLAIVAIVATLIQIGIWATAAITGYITARSDRSLDSDPASITTLRAIGFLGSVAIWTVVFLVALGNIGIDVTALIAGLGVGGIAVALALQNILGDLFASLSIVLDKPFVYGDFIVVGDMAGTVEHVGLKTTRVRSLSGEQLIFSNSDLLQSRVRNFKRLQERRILFTVGVTYQTPRETLGRIPEMLRSAVEAQPEVRFDRAHLKEFGDSSIVFEVVFFVLSAEYGMYMDRQQAINLEIARLFEEADVDFAYPTRTVFLAGASAPA